MAAACAVAAFGALRSVGAFTGATIKNGRHMGAIHNGGKFYRNTFIHMSTDTQEGASSSSSSSSTTSSSTSSSSSPESTNLVNGRISRGTLSSPDARLVSENLELVKSHLTSRRASSETLEAADTIASLNERRVSLIQSRDAALKRRNEASATVGKLMRTPQDERDVEALQEAKDSSTAAAEDAASFESQLEEVESTVSSLLASLPNLLDDSVPDGDDDSQNEQVLLSGTTSDLPQLLGWPDDDSFQPKWHDDVAAGLGGWQAEKAVSMSGARFIALSGPIARLERAISSFFLDLHTTQHSYTEMSVPYVVSRSALEGTSQLPKFEDDLFKIDPSSHSCNGEDAFLIPTAEVPLTNLHAGDVLDESDLPLSYVALTPCFRAEAGSYGRDTRGLIRTHQFAKVELVKITSAETSDREHELLTGHAQACLEALKLPYRKVRLCSGDIGFSARHCYDLEVWLPGSGEYREISSCSNTGDFQARRMGLRYRPSVVEEKDGDDDDDKDAKNQKKKNNKKKKKAKKPKPVLCHTINGSGLAVGRTLVAVLENYQMPDGSVVVPDVLRPYMGGLEILKKDD